MPYRPQTKSLFYDGKFVLCIVGLIALWFGHAFVIANGKDVLCSPNHEAYTVVLGKTWRTENKDDQCKK